MNDILYQQLIALFTGIGGEFVGSVGELAEKIGQTSGFVFDWDGVFNEGRKGSTRPASFSEPDSMGLNLLRYGYWRLHGLIPFVGLISGEKDENITLFARRERLNRVFTGIRHKTEALQSIQAETGLHPSRLLCVFDDANDLSMARQCGVRILVRRSASPLFLEYARSGNFCNYITGNSGGYGAVREVCELVLGLKGVYGETLRSRMLFDADYQQYWQTREEILTLYGAMPPSAPPLDGGGGTGTVVSNGEIGD